MGGWAHVLAPSRMLFHSADQNKMEFANLVPIESKCQIPRKYRGAIKKFIGSNAYKWLIGNKSQLCAPQQLNAARL